jgi:hypothetical protein
VPGEQLSNDRMLSQLTESHFTSSLAVTLRMLVNKMVGEHLAGKIDSTRLALFSKIPSGLPDD